MAGTQYSAELNLGINSPDVKNLANDLAEVFRTIDRLPGSAKGANQAIQEIVTNLKAIKTAIKDTGSLNSVITEVKALEASLKVISTLQKGSELFKNKDVENINKVVTQLGQASKAYDTLQRQSAIKTGNFGLDETKVIGVTRAISSLQRELNGLKQRASETGKLPAGVYEYGVAIDNNIKKLQAFRLELQRTIDLENTDKAYIAQQNVIDAQFRKSQSPAGKAATIRSDFKASPVGETAGINKALIANNQDKLAADPGVVELANTRAELNLAQQKLRVQMDALNLTKQNTSVSAELRAIDIAIAQKQKELTAEIIRENGETAKSIQLSKELRQLQSQRTIQKSQEANSDPLLKQARDQSRIDSLLSRTEGAGGAALLKVQATIQANNAIINSITGATRAAISNSIDLEAALKNVQAVTATTDTEMLGLSDNIKTVAANSKFSATEVADAALILGQAGLSAKQVAEALPSVINLATAAGTTLANAVDLVTSVVGVFDKSTGDTADIANKITAAANNSKVSVEKLGVAFQYVGNIAAQTGVSFEETTAALSAMSNAGITSGSTLGTGFRSFLTEVQKPSEEFIQALKRIGLNISDIDIRSHGLVQVVSTLKEAGFVATDAIKSFDIRSAAAFNGLIAKPGELANQLDALNNTQAAVAATAIQMDSLKSQTERLTTSFQLAVSAGFAPTQELLKSMASAAADFFGYLAQHQTALVFFVSALETLVGLKVISYFAGLAQGFLLLASGLKSATAGVASLAVVEEGAAAASLGLGAILEGVVTRIAIFTAGTVASVTGLGVFEGALVLVTAAAKGLGAILAASSIGLIVAGVTAAIYVYSQWETGTQKLKRVQDELQASLNTAKGSYDDTQRSIELVTKKIDDLIYRQNDLDGAGKNLKPTIAEINSQFSSLGLSVDSNTNSFQALLTKLRSLKTELQGVALGKLDIEIGAAQKLLASQTQGLSDSISNSQGGGAATRLNRYVNSTGVLKNPQITDSEKKSITDTIATLRASTQEDFLSNDKSGKNLQALLAIQGGINILTKYADPKQADQLKDTKNIVEAIVAKAYDVSKSKGVAAGLDKDRNVFAQKTQFENAPIFNGKTFSEALPSNRNLGAEAEAELPAGSSAKDIYPVLHQKALASYAQAEELKKQLQDLARSDEPNADVYKAAIEVVKTRQEEFVNQNGKFFSSVSEQYKLSLEGQAKVLDRQSRDPKLTQAQKASLQKKAGDLRSQFALMGVVGTNETAEARAKLDEQLADAKAQNTLDKGNPDKIPKETETAAANLAKVTASELERKAKNYKLSAEASTDLDDVDKNIQAAIVALTESKAQKVTALIHEQNAAVLPKNQTSDIQRLNAEAVIEARLKGEEEIQAFVDSSVAIYSAVYKKKNALKLGADVADIATTKEKGEQALFDVSRPLAATTIGVASQKIAPGSSQQKVQELDVTRQSILNLTEEIASYTKYIDDLNVALKSAQDEVYKAQNDVNTAVDNIQKRIAQGRLDEAQKQEKEIGGQLKGAVTNRQSAQKSLDSNTVTAAEQAANLPLDFNVDNITKKLATVGSLYGQTVQNFDTVGAIGTGIQGTLQGLAGGFSTMFENITSGSMTAGQAFKAFAANVIKSMIDIITQALVMQAFKGILSAFGFNVSGGGSTLSSSSDINSIYGTVGYGHNGGIVTTMGGGSIITAATGGLLTGGITGKDSIPAMVMPGEFILKKSAVDAVGADTLHAMNNGSASLVSNSSTMASNTSKTAPGMLNIWVVTPDQQQSMGPNDVLVTVADSLNQSNSTIKSLVKQIALGEA